MIKKLLFVAHLLAIGLPLQAQTPAYRVYEPADFDPALAYPVLICPEDIVDGEPESWCWRELSHDRGWIRVGTSAHLAGQPDNLLDVLDAVERRYNVSGGRFHLAGFSANSGPAFEVVLAHPERFASITGIPGHPRTADPNRLRRLSDVHVMLIVGSDDSYWLSEARRAREALDAVGVEVTLDVIPDGGHILRSVFGDGLFDRLSALHKHIVEDHS